MTIATHLEELRTRLFWSCLAFILFAVIGYSIHDHLLELLQRPLGETLYYTSPAGGFNFVFKISASFGLIFSTPIILYNAVKFIKPAYDIPRKSILVYGFSSLILACSGALFAYFVSLPAALQFLTQFGGTSITPIITADEYFNFALAYVGGFAVLFQLILIIAIINRIKPLKPREMLKTQKYLIVGSFIIAAILTPTPDPVNQAIMAIPVVLMYQISIVYVWLKNSRIPIKR